MTAVYLKNKSKYPYCEIFVCITEKNVTIIEYTSIEVEINENSISDELEWYISEWEMKESTKKEFDEFYIKIAKEINESINN